MAQIEMPNILGQFLQGQQAGQGERRQKTLSDFLQPALGGDKGALAKIYGADADTGLQVQGLAQKQTAADHEQKLGQLELAAKAWRAADPTMRQQLYPSIAELTESVLPQFAGKIPREYSPQYEANIDKFLSGFAGNEQEQFTLSPGSARYDASGRQIVSQPFAPASMQPIQTDQGYASYNPKTGTAAPLNYEGHPAGGDQSKIQNALAMLAGGQGVQMTSGMRTPERNAAVGGKPNSQHLRGTAGDYVVPQDQKAQFIQQAQAAGLQAIDEGDHIHVQQPRGGRVMPAAKSSAPSDFERRIAMAQSMGATPDQLKQMVVGETGGGKPSATQIKLANTAKAKLIDLKAMDDQIALVEKAFKPLKNSYSAGPGGGVLPTVEGKQFDAAVALLKGMARKLTRTPGEGAMSDYESKLAELANPSRSEYEDVTADQLTQLRALVKTTREGYEALLQDAGGSTDNLPGNGGAPKAGTIEAGYRFKGGDPSDPSNWEKV